MLCLSRFCGRQKKSTTQQTTGMTELHLVQLMQTTSPPVLPCLQSSEFLSQASVECEGRDVSFCADVERARSLMDPKVYCNRHGVAVLFRQFFYFYGYKFDIINKMIR